MSDRKRKLDLADEPGPSGYGAAGGGINPFTGRPYTQRYFDIMAKRVDLPVWQAKEDFVKMINEHQTTILVGEWAANSISQASGSSNKEQVCKPGAPSLNCR